MQLTVEEAQTRLRDLLDAAARGETVRIIGDDQQVIQLLPIGLAVQAPRYVDFESAYSGLRLFADPAPSLPKRSPQFGNAAGTGWMADDFDAPLEEFAEYME